MKLTPRPYQPARLIMILITYFMVLIAFLQCRKIHHTLKAATNKSKVLQGFEDPEIAIREPTAVRWSRRYNTWSSLYHEVAGGGAPSLSWS